MRDSKFLLVVFLTVSWITVLSSQTTVTKTWMNPATTTIDGTGDYGGTLGTVLFSSADVPSCEIVTNVEVQIVWAKTAGTCAIPGVGSSLHEESSFRLDGPNGTQVIIAPNSTWTGNATSPLTTMTFSDGATTPSGTPVDGTFASNEVLSAFDNLNPEGNWELKPGDNLATAPMCVTEYSVSLTFDNPSLGANLANSNGMSNCTVGDGETKTFMNGSDYIGQITDASGGTSLGDVNMEVRIDGGPTSCNGTFYLERNWKIDVNGTNGSATVKVYAADPEMIALAAALGHADVPTMITAGLDITAFSAVNPADEGCGADPANFTNTLISSPTITAADPVAGIWSIEFPVSSFSTFFLHGSNGQPLPVELVSFDGRNVKESNELEWKTLSEINFSHYEIERRGFNSEFEKIGELATNGDSTEERIYKFTDREPLAGENYYRLKMIDLDGSYNYSHVIRLKTDKSHLIGYFPNPSKDAVSLNIYSKDEGNATFMVHDITGKQVLLDNRSVIQGNSTETLDLAILPIGLYIVKIIMPNSSSPISIKILKE